jgi:hypothetical protein
MSAINHPRASNSVTPVFNGCHYYCSTGCLFSPNTPSFFRTTRPSFNDHIKDASIIDGLFRIVSLSAPGLQKYRESM